MSSPTALRQRLLQDIAELQAKPYPNITLHVQDEDITIACLILDDVDGYGPMHLTVFFPHDYPLSPPQVQMNSHIRHPNIFGTYICASILNTVEGYTPAYTLKGIAIQLLSFFGSDSIEQSGGGHSVKLGNFRDGQSRVLQDHICKKCNFGVTRRALTTTRGSLVDYLTVEAREFLSQSEGSESGSVNSSVPTRSMNRNARRSQARRVRAAARAIAEAANSDVVMQDVEIQVNGDSNGHSTSRPSALLDASLPDEILLMICENLDFEELMAFAQSWPRISRLITQYDMIRTRELQCFCFKKDYMNAELGVGVAVEGKLITSEFDLISREAYQDHSIRRSVFGKEFQHWLPLPISYGHWRKVNQYLTTTLTAISQSMSVNIRPVDVIFHFMNDIVVKLNQAAEVFQHPVRRHYNYHEPVKSSLTHASEKAIESYFHLFHLLLCMATTDANIVAAANRTLQTFLSGRTSKTDCPNLGHLLVAALITDVPINDKLTKSIVREAITRNVVWMFKEKPELSYIEPTSTSEYRLRETFLASRTSYRLLMFLNLFRRVAVGSPRTKSLAQLRDEAFARHGAPPLGSAKGLADSIKRIHKIDNFPDFLTAMGIERPSKLWFCGFLKDCIGWSRQKGYHRMPLAQGEALALRRLKEPGVQIAGGVVEHRAPDMKHSGRSFFPRDDRGGRRIGNRRRY